ncbi:hypothetical protein ACJX0J_042018, partial [Zea mays]
ISLYNHGHQELVLPFRLFRMEECRMVLQILFLGLLNILDPNASFAQMWQKMIVTLIASTPASSKVLEK